MIASAAPPGVWVEQFRHYLSALARLSVDRKLCGRLDLSGIVQQTLLEAHQAPDPPPASDPDGRLAWVKRLFLNNLRDEVRKLKAARRDVGRDLATGYGLLVEVPAELSSPSRQASRAEELLRLTAALATLPDDQRDAVEFRYLLGLGVDEVAARLGKSRAAAAGLLRRGLRKLRDRLAGDRREG